jgi:hypothetical protein
MPLSADDIKRAFDALSEELEHQRQQAELIVVGGAELVLLFQARESTKDVEIWSTVKPHIPPHQLDKASYAFEDLWETLHEHT